MIKGKYKRKLNAVFLLIFTLLTVVSTSIIFLIVMDKKAKVYNSAMAYASQSILSNVQVRFETINSALQLVQEGKEMADWTESNSSELFYFGMVRVQEQLRKVSSKLSSNYQIAATFDDEESLVITPYSSETKEYFYHNNLGLSEAKIRGISQHFNKSNKYLVFSLDNDEEFPRICYVTQKSYRKRDVLYFTLIDTKSFFEYGEVYDWYICNDQGIFASNGDVRIDNTDMYQAFQESGLAYNFKYKNRIVYAQPFNNIDWTLLSSYDNDTINYSQIIITFIIIVLVMLLVVFYLARVVTNRLYRPFVDVIGEELSKGSQRQFDEFKVLRDNSLKIKTINNQLKLALEDRNNLMNQRINRELLLGMKSNSTVQTEYRLQESSYYVAIIEFIHNPFANNEEEIFISKNEILAYIQKHSDIRYANIDSHTSAFIIQSVNEEESIRVKVHKLLEKLNINYDVRVAISNKINDTSKINEAFNESKKILEYKFLFNEKIILTMENIEELKRDNYYYPISTENKLIHCVLNGNIQAIEIFNEVIEENNTSESLSPVAFKNLIFALTSTIGRIIQELKIDSTQFSSTNGDYISLSEQWNNKDIIPNLRGVLEELLLYVKKNTRVKEDSIADDMLAYIHENYSDNIMLVDLAQLLNVSEKYCSILFKKAIGVNFKSYLNSYRIDQAKEYIHNTPDIKTSRLGKMVGFNSSNTFIRVFTKYTGLTPKAYAFEINKKDNNKEKS